MKSQSAKFSIKALIKSVSLTSLDSYSFSLIFFAVSIIAARKLAVEEVAVYGLIFSVYLLSQSIFISCVGESIVIHRREGLPDSQVLNFSFFMCLLISSIIIPIAALFVFFPLGLSVLEVFVIFFSTLLLILIQSFRYLHLANGHPLGAAVVGISLAAFGGAMISWEVELLDLNRAVNLYAVLGVSAALVFALKIAFIKVRFEPKGVASIFWKRWNFTKKATKLNVSIWLAGNLPWIILGVYLNQTLLGILRACLTLVNPIQTIERGFTNALLVDASAPNIDTPRLLKVFLRYITLFSSIYLCILTLWFFNAEAIVILSIGDKYLSYISSISVLLFIPIFQVISTFSSAILKSKHIFWPQTTIYIFTPVLMVPAVWYFSSGDLPDPVVWVMAFVAFIQAVFIFGVFIRTIFTVTEAVDAR